ncbi:hypothetical protein ACJW31_02G109600 [Castanea mollissima]
MSTTYPVVPGEPTQTGTAFLETATATAPINKIHQHLCAFHFYAYDMSRQVDYCAHQNEEVRQCLTYDSPDANARLIGVERSTSGSHEYEVKSGVLFMPGVSAPIQRQDMEKMASTIYEQLIKDVESRYGISVQKERENRGYMSGPTHGIHPLANGGGKGLKTELRETVCKPTDSVPRVFV